MAFGFAAGGFGMFPGFSRPARTGGGLEEGVAVAGDAMGVEGLLDEGEGMAGGAQEVDVVVGGGPDAHAQAAHEAGDLEAQVNEGGKLAVVLGTQDAVIELEALPVGGGEQVFEAGGEGVGAEVDRVELVKDGRMGRGLEARVETVRAGVAVAGLGSDAPLRREGGGGK
jgi:hypothetical protein